MNKIIGTGTVLDWVRALRLATDLEVHDNGDIEWDGEYLEGYSREGSLHRLTQRPCRWRLVTITEPLAFKGECLRGLSCSSCSLR